MVFGEPVKAFLDTYFDLAVIAFAVLFVGGFYVINLLARRTAGRQVAASLSQSGNSSPSVEG